MKNSASVFLGSLLAGSLLMSGCVATGGGLQLDWGEPGYAKNNMPPAHAPAHGRRAKQRHRYHYYPDASVYFDIGRGMYFYLSGDNWQAAVSLPQRLRLGEHVSIEMGTDKPYTQYKYHKAKYPPGQMKKKNKNKHKNKGYW